MATPSSAATSTPAVYHLPPFSISKDAPLSAGSRAIVPQQQPAAGISHASDNAALGIRHQNKRVILLVAA
jgi:hypothetical protein